METQKAKFNWGWGILGFITLFVSFILFMVYMTTTIDSDLVTADYYQQEIEFQKKIDSKNNLAQTGKHISVSEEINSVKIILPKNQKEVIENVKICFYRPSNEDMDLKLNYPAGEIFEVSSDRLVKGEYIIQAEWKVDDKNYYEEIKFVKS